MSARWTADGEAPSSHALTGRINEWLHARGAQVLVTVHGHGHGQQQIEIAQNVDLVHDFALPPLVMHALVETIHANSASASRRATGASASNLDPYQADCAFYDALTRDDRHLRTQRIRRRRARTGPQRLRRRRGARGRATCLGPVEIQARSRCRPTDLDSPTVDPTDQGSWAVCGAGPRLVFGAAMDSRVWRAMGTSRSLVIGPGAPSTSIARTPIRS